MARLSQGILGGISGKIGNLVGSSWKGIAVIKTKALSVANPRTAAQVAQRDSMTFIVAFAQGILSTIIKPLNDRFAQGMSGFNLFVSRNIQYFSTSVPASPESIVISRGKMAAPEITSVVSDRSLNTVVVNWNVALDNPYAQATDKAYILAAFWGSGNQATVSGTIVRSAGTATLPLPAAEVVGDNVTVYLAFLRNDNSIVSDSAAMDVNTIA